jgi:hypothetical protein
MGAFPISSAQNHPKNHRKTEQTLANACKHAAARTHRRASMLEIRGQAAGPQMEIGRFFTL